VVYATEGFLGVDDPLGAGLFLHQMIEVVGLGEVLEGREDALPGRRKAARKSGIDVFLTTTLAALDVCRGTDVARLFPWEQLVSPHIRGVSDGLTLRPG
jgi:hypothetical protein